MTPDYGEFTPPTIAPVPAGVHRPQWSVMIPTYNCAAYLRQTLESVLQQAPGPDGMQIEVVDDCSTRDDPEAVVREVGQGRVAFYCQANNVGATNNFNTCIMRSRGHLVHILHGDDYVLPGFYDCILQLEINHPQCAIYATRVFVVDENGVIKNVSSRETELELGSTNTRCFFRGTPLQFAGVIVRRRFFENYGGFLRELVHTADWEMWSRAFASEGGAVSPGVLACYRSFEENDTSRLARTGENVRDYKRLSDLLAARHSDFDVRGARLLIAQMAYQQAERFSASGNVDAAASNWKCWREYATWQFRVRKLLGRFVRITVGLH